MDVWQTIEGQAESWDVIVIGHLRWNRYWGESAGNPPRGQPSTCTSTLIRGRDAEGRPYLLLVDPTWRVTASDYYFDLNRRTGLRYSDITHCYVTHDHKDHQMGLNYFPNAVWCAAPPVQAILAGSADIDGARVRGVTGEFLPGVAPVALPGHTASLHGLAVRCSGRRIVVAGDAVMTRDHYREETTEFELDAAQAAETIRLLKSGTPGARFADVVIPGHDNLLINWP